MSPEWRFCDCFHIFCSIFIRHKFALWTRYDSNLNTLRHAPERLGDKPEGAGGGNGSAGAKRRNERGAARGMGMAALTWCT